jgi:hypothetical protein
MIVKAFSSNFCISRYTMLHTMHLVSSNSSSDSTQFKRASKGLVLQPIVHLGL